MRPNVGWEWAALLALGMAATGRVKAAAPRIPVEDADQWRVEVFAGHTSGGEFVEGPRRGSGSPGAMAFDEYGNAFVAAGTCVYLIHSGGEVRLLAGVPGLPGTADGAAARRACFGALNSIAYGPDKAVYLSDAGNFCIRKLYRDAAGAWTVATVAGVAGRKGHRDGRGAEVLLQRPEGLAFDSKGNLYTMDQDWLRRISPDGQVLTLNPKGGTGKTQDGPIEGARFNRIMGSGPISTDADDNLYQSDLWNNSMRKTDLKAGVVTTIASSLPWKQGDPRVADGNAMTEARFHGVNTAIFDPVTGRIYVKPVDEDAIRCLCPDGIVRTFGPLGTGKGPMSEGPLTKADGSGYPCGIDPQGRVYVGQGGLIYRVFRDPPFPKAAAAKTPNPIPAPAPAGRPAASSATVELRAPAGGSAAALASGDPAVVSTGSDIPARLRVKLDGKAADVALDPAVATAEGRTLRVFGELHDAPGSLPKRAIRGQWLDAKGDPSGGPFDIAPSGCGPVAAFDGAQFVAAYESGGSIYARRIGRDGRLLDEQPVKMGGQWEHRPAIAANGSDLVVTGARRPWPNPWGWNGPATISIGRLTRDGKTPERFSMGQEALADGGFAGLVDRSQWKGHKGWPAGRPGGFSVTENGYWPHMYSAVCWDGKTWVVAWVRGKMSGMNLTDMDIFACRVDPKTMMPTGEPVLVAGGDAEPGTQTRPALAALGDGVSLLVYVNAAPDGSVRIIGRTLAAGPLTGPERVAPVK